MGLEFGVIADDPTGSLIVAGMLEREGVTCPLATQGRSRDELVPWRFPPFQGKDRTDKPWDRTLRRPDPPR